jgi:TonB-dependent receptor
VSWHTADYRYGALPNSEAVANLLTTSPAVFLEDTDKTAVNSRSGDYNATETVWALYGMGKMTFGRWTLLGGARVEGTENRARGNQVQFAPSGALLGFTSAETTKSYTKALPGVHLRFDPDGGLVFRSSVTRTIARPGFADLVPYRSISFPDRRTRSGNPDLVPYESTNYDLSVDKFSEKLGLFSLAFFYKDIAHFLSDATYQVTLGELGQFTEYKKINGDAAKAMGAETSWQSPAWDLPAALGKASLNVNYSYLHGEAHYATRPGDKFPMPEQVNYQGSVSAHVESARWSVDGSLRYRSKWWEDIIAHDFDNYLAGYWDADLSATCKLSKVVRVTAGLGNILDQPQKKYAGSKNRPNDYLQTGVDLNVGVQWKL